jgi:hypothetical protein
MSKSFRKISKLVEMSKLTYLCVHNYVGEGVTVTKISGDVKVIYIGQDRSSSLE